MTVRPLSQSLVPVAERLGTVLQQLSRVVVGKADPLRVALACLLARGHLLIEDIPGVGKSTLAQALATTLGLNYAQGNAGMFTMAYAAFMALGAYDTTP